MNSVSENLCGLTRVLALERTNRASASEVDLILFCNWLHGEGISCGFDYEHLVPEGKVDRPDNVIIFCSWMSASFKREHT